MVISESKPISTQNNLLYGLAVCVFPVHIWAIYHLLRELPGWVMRMGIWELMGVMAYTLVFALLESTVILLAVVILSYLIPARFYRNNFLPLTVLLLFIISGWFAFIQLNDDAIRDWGKLPMLLLAILFLVTVAGSYLLVRRSVRLRNWLNAFIQKLSILSFFYIFLDLVGLIVIVIRNLAG